MNGNRAVYPIPVIPLDQDKMVVTASLSPDGGIRMDIRKMEPVVVEMQVSAKARIHKLRAGLGGEKDYAGQWKVIVNYEMFDAANDADYSWGEPPAYFPVWGHAIKYALDCVYPKKTPLEVYEAHVDS